MLSEQVVCDGQDHRCVVPREAAIDDVDLADVSFFRWPEMRSCEGESAGPNLKRRGGRSELTGEDRGEPAGHRGELGDRVAEQDANLVFREGERHDGRGG